MLPGESRIKYTPGRFLSRGASLLLIVLSFGWIVKQNDFGDLWKVLLPASHRFRGRYSGRLSACPLLGEACRWRYLRLGLLIVFGIQVHVIEVIFEGIPRTYRGCA